ncbi:MAG: CHRD domain-containing protein [Chloroflexota bacterium]|nr:CHRD domain-containing protein [Chloroflexota bacterium]
MSFRRLLCVVALAVGLVALPGSALAQETNEAHPTFVTVMTGFEEVPGAATLATGYAGILVSHDRNTVYYSITLTDASTRIVAAHLHFAPRGEAGPVVVPLCGTEANPCQTEGLVTQGSFTAEQFTGPFLNDNLDRLIQEARAGLIYANVHSTKFPNGEARGQLVDLASLMREPEPTMPGEPTMGQ